MTLESMSGLAYLDVGLIAVTAAAAGAVIGCRLERRAWVRGRRTAATEASKKA